MYTEIALPQWFFHMHFNIDGKGHTKDFVFQSRGTGLDVKPPVRKLVRERNVLFNDALNTFYLWLYGVRHMVKDHSDSEKGT